MGLWDEMFEQVSDNSVVLPRIEHSDNLINVCENRYSELELGFVEGFWGGKEDIKVLLSVALRGKMSSSDFSVQNS